MQNYSPRFDIDYNGPNVCLFASKKNSIGLVSNFEISAAAQVVHLHFRLILHISHGYIY